MKKILVTTDLSEESTRAFASAVLHAERIGSDAKIIALCVLPDLAKSSLEFAMGFAFMDTEGAYERAFEKTTVELKELVEKSFSGVKVEPVVIPSTGATYQSILDFAETEDVEMIVLASHGRTGIKHAVLGSVVERIVREATKPVLVVPAKG